MTNAVKQPVYFLLVDDREQNLIALDALLKREELILLKAHSGPEALELLLKYDVALALIDVQMPNMDGFELAELMRGTERTRRVPIIFLTAGNTDQQRRFRGYEAGAVDFLQKPIEADVIRSKAAVFFDLFRERQEVARQRDELAQMIEENSRLLSDSRQKAQALVEADRRKDEFLATLAHELRNPLSPIASALSLLKDCSENPRQVQKLTEIADRQVKQLIRLVDDLLDVSRISRGKVVLQRSDCSLEQIIQQSVEAVWGMAREAKHALAIVPFDSSLRVNGDAARVTQIVTNLLSNAVKYTPAGGQIRVACFSDGEFARIDVTDNGIGIPADRLSHVFELFTQLHTQVLSGNTGLGVGLALVRQLVELHGGRVEIFSEGEGKGTRVSVWLPKTAPVAAATTAENASNSVYPRSSIPSRRVLVVDDLRANTLMLRRLLERMGHQVKTANDAGTSLELVESFQPEVVISDIAMPGMSGYELAAEIRKRHGGTICLVALTGYGMPADRDRAAESGFDHHMVKPPDTEVLERFFGTL